MRYRSTRERRKEREEFVYRHAEEISELLYLPHDDQRIKDFIINKVLMEIDYNYKTFWDDIWHTIKRTFCDLFGVSWNK